MSPPAARAGTVLFYIRNATGYFRIFESVLRELLARGHRVHVALDARDQLGGDVWLERLTEEEPRFTFKNQRTLRDSHWHALARNLRLTRDFIEVLSPTFHAAPELLLRAERRAPAIVQRAYASGRLRSPRAVAFASRLLRALEAAVPVFGSSRKLVQQIDPDVVVLAPHLMPGSLHTMQIRVAQSLGLRTAVAVASWDNLSSKQLLRVEPDSVIVWNDVQRSEAIELHGIDPARIVVTGAQCYDHWFSWQPRSREAFCERVGLDPARPYVAYVGGSLFPAATTEAEFAGRWADAVRSSSDPRLASAGILFRPHPKRGDEWRALDLDRWENVTLWPPGGQMPVEGDAKADFFDSIHHSAAVVGINTSAMIETAIVGRPVLTVLAPEFAGSQDGVFHFRYLRRSGGGILTVGADVEEHLAQLATVLAGASAGGDREGFLRAFVRPHGLETPATPLFVDEVERLAALGRRPADRWSVSHLPLTAALAPVALVMDRRERKQALRKKVKTRERLAAAAAKTSPPITPDA